MKIQLAPGEKLRVGFYIPSEQIEPSGWSSSPPDDQPLDGEFLIEYRENAIVVSADLPDDDNRGGHESLNEMKSDSEVPDVTPIIYYASFGDPSDDVECSN